MRLPERLAGRRVLAIERRAKYLLWRLEGGETLLLHLGGIGDQSPDRHQRGDRGEDREQPIEGHAGRDHRDVVSADLLPYAKQNVAPSQRGDL